jgi:hypothetical protein
MSDTTKCYGADCPMKDSCKRFTAPADELHQSYFLDPPYHINEGGFSCDMYWGAQAEGIWNMLQEAVGIHIPNFNDMDHDAMGDNNL